ncbi:hypothetical protein TH53_20945 [Pedobacter lusitanus]|uniref:Contig102, whole genome shotgun sequence n=1 Tax=Pedobacter lusitanus TaxID=1503925 RepID=A0A0D0GM09_9SPHI|nr:RagB/SusD family nutrient uptake outer membrane protein [Pedobacter lusitanus]KIO75446.1 hypothetical protein TH53_20945 [Pedobacter lusitanus]
MKNSLYLSIAFIALFMSSCKKGDLDLVPTDKLSPTTFWKTEADASAAITGCYSALWDVTSQVQPYLEVLTPNAYSEYPWEGWKNIALSAQSPTDLGGFGGVYKGAYAGIAATNNFLGNIESVTMPEASKNVMKGEARFLRAYYYSILANYWGGVPLLLEKTDLNQRNMPKSTKDEVVAQIIKDLEIAAPLLPATPAQKGRITKGAALALKTRVLLYNKRWAEAATAAQSVMAMSYSLFPDYRGLFTEASENNQEVIFDVQFLAPKYATNWDTYIGIYDPALSPGWSSIEPTQDLVDEYEMKDGTIYSPSNPAADSADPNNNRDPRLDQTLFRKGVLYNSKPYPVSADGWPGVYTGYSFKKYTVYDNTTSTSVSDNQSQINGIVLRYADILLMYAEAKNEASGPDQSVYDAINMVRNRSSIKMPPLPAGLSQETMRQRIRHERRIEFAGEGLYYSDVKRWGIAETVLNRAIKLNGAQKKGAIEQRVFRAGRDYLMPFSQNDIDSDPNLVQNPGY